MSKDRRLGRGLAALLGDPLQQRVEEDSSAAPEPAMRPRLHQPEQVESSLAPTDAPETTGSGIHLLDVHEIQENPFQPRREFNEVEIASLAESLKDHDMLQPILVRQVDGCWQLISGERRLRAAIRAGWEKIPARVREADDRLVAELAIVENLQRKDLNPIEKALSFQRYLQEHDCTKEDLGKRLKIDRSTIANLLRLLELPENVQQSLRDGQISAGHARALLPLGDEHLQIEFSRRIQADGLSVREVERQVQEKIQEDDQLSEEWPDQEGDGSKRSRATNQVASLEQELRNLLGTKVEIRQTTSGRGRIVLHFKNPSEFERLRSHILDPCSESS